MIALSPDAIYMLFCSLCCIDGIMFTTVPYTFIFLFYQLVESYSGQTFDKYSVKQCIHDTKNRIKLDQHKNSGDSVQGVKNEKILMMNKNISTSNMLAIFIAKLEVVILIKILTVSMINYDNRSSKTEVAMISITMIITIIKQ